MRELFVQFKNIYKSAVKDIDNGSFVKRQSEAKEAVKESAQLKDTSNRVGVE